MFYETAGDAVRALAAAYRSPNGLERGVKVFAKRLFSKKSDSQAYTRLMNCTNPSCAEEFDPDDWMLIFQIGREQGMHDVAEFFMGGALYHIEPIEPEQKATEIMRRVDAYREGLRRELAELDRLPKAAQRS